MSDSKLQYKKMSLEELVVLSQQNDLKALEELIKREQKNVFACQFHPEKSSTAGLRILKNFVEL